MPKYQNPDYRHGHRILFYSECPDYLWLSFRKQGQTYQVGYGLADVDVRRVGFGLGWVTGYCHLQGYGFREPLETLRH